MAGTKITPEERYALLDSMIAAVKTIQAELADTKNKLTSTADTVSSYNALLGDAANKNKELQDRVETAVKSIEKQLAGYRDEADRLRQYSQDIDQTIETRLTLIQERFDNLNKTLDVVSSNVNATREIDLVRMNDRITDLPNLESIRKELSTAASPLTTKNDFRDLEVKVSHIEGSVNSHFRNSLISLFLALATMIATNVVTFATFSSKVERTLGTATDQVSPDSTDSTVSSPEE